jgi:lysophospholipase L1-like esterase
VLVLVILVAANLVSRLDRRAEDVTTAPPSSGSTARPGSTGPTPATHPAPAAGTSPATGPLRLLGFGDSVMAGAGCDCDDFLAQTADLLKTSTGREVDTVNNGANGESAGDVLRELRTDDALAVEVRQADVIVLTIGANDLSPALDSWVDDDCGRDCYHPEVGAMGDTLSAILTLVGRDKKPRASVFVTSYWNVFEDGDIGTDDYGDGYLSWSDQVTRDANATLCRAARLAGATCVDLYVPFKGADGKTDPTRLLADDGDHPNDAGTLLIATVLAAAVHRSGAPR